MIGFWGLLTLGVILLLIARLRLRHHHIGKNRSALPLEEVQFTVYRPKVIRPGEWYPLLAFTHLADRRPDAPTWERDPIELVRAQAEQVLGPNVGEYRDTSVDARRPVPREGQITLVPVVHGLEFNPERRTFRWLEDVHREEFRFRVVSAADGSTARGRLTAYLGSILLAEIDLVIRVDSADRKSTAIECLDSDTAQALSKDFCILLASGRRDRRSVRGVDRGLRRPLSTGCPRPPSRGGMGPPPPRVDRRG